MVMDLVAAAETITVPPVSFQVFVRWCLLLAADGYSNSGTPMVFLQTSIEQKPLLDW